MNLLEAIRSGRPYRRKHWNNGNGQWRETPDIEEYWHQAYTETLGDLLADDWEIQEPLVEITRTQFWEVVNARGPDYRDMAFALDLARKLGLEDK